MQLPLYPLIRFYFRSTGTRNLNNAHVQLAFSAWHSWAVKGLIAALRLRLKVNRIRCMVLGVGVADLGEGLHWTWTRSVEQRWQLTSLSATPLERSPPMEDPWETRVGLLCAWAGEQNPMILLCTSLLQIICLPCCRSVLAQGVTSKITMSLRDLVGRNGNIWVSKLCCVPV